jgi:hypothetical protein
MHGLEVRAGPEKDEKMVRARGSRSGGVAMALTCCGYERAVVGVSALRTALCRNAVPGNRSRRSVCMFDDDTRCGCHGSEAHHTVNVCFTQQWIAAEQQSSRSVDQRSTVQHKGLIP